MKKLLYAAIGATLTLVSASPAFASDPTADQFQAVENRLAIERDIAALTARTAGTTVLDEAVLGETAILDTGLPLEVGRDMLTALRGDVAKNNALGRVPRGGNLFP
jgi:hypothetical protein